MMSKVVYLTIDGDCSSFFKKKKVSLSYFNSLKWDSIAINLKSLDVQNIQKFPISTLPNFGRLDKLTLTNVDSIKLYEFDQRFKTLSTIRLNDCKKTTLFDNHFCLPNLACLEIMNCNFDITMDFATNSDLKELYLYNNYNLNFDVLLEKIPCFKQLEILWNTTNIIDILPQSFINLDNLMEVNLVVSNDAARNGLFDVLYGMKSIKHLYLSSVGEIYGLDSVMFNPKIDSLRLECDIRKFPSNILKIDSLKYLRIQFDKSVEIPSDLFSLPNLKELDFIDYTISEIPDEIEKMESLEILRLNITDLKWISPKISKLKNLKYVFYEGINVDACNTLNRLLPKCSISYSRRNMNIDYLGQ